MCISTIDKLENRVKEGEERGMEAPDI